MNNGYRPLGLNLPKTSVTWYRRCFELPTSDSGKRIWLTFGGVMHNATVWVIGQERRTLTLKFEGRSSLDN
jgi:hypothetical protein